MRPAPPRAESRRARSSRPAPARPTDPLLAAALRAQAGGVLIARSSPGRGQPRVVFVNDSLRALAGGSADGLVGQPLSALHPAGAERTRLLRWLRTAQPGQTFAGEGPIRHGREDVLSAAWHFGTVCNRRGQLTHVVGVYHDQTGRRRLQDELVHAQRLDAVGHLAGGIAHDFKNLLSVINGYCEMLAASVAAQPQALREVAEIHYAGQKAAALIQQLLAFSRRQPFHARVVCLNALVTANAAILRRLVGDAGQLEFTLAADLPRVRTDPAQFQQVLLNLVLNARDALRGAGRITVATRARELAAPLPHGTTTVPAGRYLALSVADNGTGIDPETARHLFEPFHTTKPEGKGTGLGLALAYGVVRQSGGHILVRTTPRVGSTFEILLPSTEEPVTPEPPAMLPLASSRGTEHVLVVEDDDLVRKMVAGIFTADGYEVTAVKSPAGLPVTRARPFDLWIGSLAGEGGRAARRLCRNFPELRILCTNPGDLPFPVAWVQPAHQRLLPKPFALNELVRAARVLLDAGLRAGPR